MIFSSPEFSGLSGLFLCIIVMTLVEWIQRKEEVTLRFNVARPVRWLVYVFVVLLIVVFGGHSVNFIYFQF